MHVHNVFFWLNECDDDSRSEFERGLDELPNMALVEAGYWGLPAGVNRPVVDNSYDYALTLIFKSREDHDAYQVHPDHDVFVKNFKELWARVQVYDTTSR